MVQLEIKPILKRYIDKHFINNLKFSLLNEIIEYKQNSNLILKTFGKEKAQIIKKLKILENNIQIKNKLLENEGKKIPTHFF